MILSTILTNKLLKILNANLFEPEFRKVSVFNQIQPIFGNITFIYCSKSAFYLYFQIQLSKFSKYNSLCSIFQLLAISIFKHTLVPHHNKSALSDISILSSTRRILMGFFGRGASFFFFLLYQNLQIFKMSTKKDNDGWIINKNLKFILLFS